MKILLLGADGQLGQRLRDALPVLGPVTALSRRGDGALCGDLADADGLALTVRAVAPDVVVNAAAYTAVDRAESEPDAAFAVNAVACEVLAKEVAALGGWLVHYSTDYVFDGSGSRAWHEDDPVAPLNVYGRSKLAGERAVAAHCPNHLVLRTSWVFDSGGQNFLKAILRAAGERESLQVVDDQWGAPTGARLISTVTLQLLRSLDPAKAGLYHLAAGGECSRHAMAVHAIRYARALGMPLRTGPDAIRPVPTSAFPAPAQRPLNSRMDTARLRATFGVDLPPWQEGVEEAVRELATQGPVVTMKR